MLKELERRMDKQNKKLEVFNKELENIKNQTELKNTITKIKNTSDGINSGLDDTREIFSELENRVVEITQTEQKKRKKLLKRGQFKRPGTTSSILTFTLYVSQKR